MKPPQFATEYRYVLIFDTDRDGASMKPPQFATEYDEAINDLHVRYGLLQ